MKCTWLLLPLLLFGITLLFADQMWEDPSTVFQYDNVNFTGLGAPTGDGGEVLCWMDDSSGTTKCYLQKYNLFMLPQWTQPCIMPFSSLAKVSVVATSDNAVMVFWAETVYSNTSLKVTKINAAGEIAWNPAARTVLANLQGGVEATFYKVVADGQAGTSLLYQQPYTHSLRFQHVFTDGTLSNSVIGGLNVNPTSESINDFALLPAPNNGLLMAVSIMDSVRISSVSPQGVVEWTHTLGPFPNSTYNTKVQLYTKPTNGTYLCISNAGIVKAYSFDDSGTSLWTNGVTVFSGNLTQNLRNVSTTRSADGSLYFCCTHVDSLGTVILQKLNTSGTCQWGANGIHVHNRDAGVCYTSLVTDDSNGCYLSYGVSANSFLSLKTVHLSAWGVPWLIPYHVTGSMNGSYLPLVRSNRLLLAWMDRNFPIGGIRAQGFNDQGEPMLGDSGRQVRVSGYGSAVETATASNGNNLLTAWLLALDDYSSPLKDVYYQITDSNGNNLLPDNGARLCNTYRDIKTNLQAAGAGDGSTMVIWQHTDGLWGQLLDAAGNLQWEPEGRLLCPDSEIGTYKLAADGNVYYLLWTAPNDMGYLRIFGQKYAGGIAQWNNPGVQLVTDHPQYPDYQCVLSTITGRYFTWLLEPEITINYNGFAYAGRFEEDGSCATGFQSYGNAIANLPTGYLGQNILQSTLWNNDLIVAVDNWSIGPYGAGAEGLMQRITPTGTLLWNVAGRTWDTTAPFLIVDNSIYTWQQNTGVYKYNSNLTYQACYQAPSPYHYLERVKMQSIDGTRIAISGWRYNMGIYHVYLDLTTHNYLIPTDVALSEYSFTACLLDEQKAFEAVVVNWQLHHQSWGTMQMQRVDNGHVGVSDSTSHRPVVLSLSPAYPNPFTHEMKATYSLDRDCQMQLSIYNVKGQLVSELVKEKQKRGNHEVIWDGKDCQGQRVAPGIYYYRLKAQGKELTRKCILLR